MQGDRKKILFITNDDNIYGANRALLSLIEELQKRDCICDVLLSKNGVITEELDKLSVKHYIYKTCTWACYTSEKKWKNIIRIVYNRVMFWIISKMLKKEHYDLIHTNSSVTNLGAYLSKKWSCKHVWHIREIQESYGLAYIYPDKFVNQQFESADRVIAISDFVAGYCKKKLSPKTKIDTIYDGVRSVDPKHKENKIFSFCIVGIISEYKGQLDVCKSIKMIRDRGINDFICYIIGGVGDKDYYKKLCRFISDNKLEKNVLMVGHTSTPYTYYNKSDVGIMASKNEGFGLVTIEYMLNELLVLGAKSGATPELVNDGINGFLFEQGDYNALAEKMIWCLNNKGQVEQMGKESRLYAIKNFSIENHVNQVYSLYSELLMDIKNNGA